MTEQIVIGLDESSELTKSEWKDFVISLRGKWRGAASDVGEKALLEFMRKQEEIRGGGSTESERLRRENERLHDENDRLSDEVERLRSATSDGGAPTPTPSERSRQRTNNAESDTKIAGSSESAKQAEADGTEADAGEAGESWWGSYDADDYDDFEPDESITVPEEAVKELGEMDVEEVPSVVKEHVKPASVPYKGKKAKQMLVVAGLRGEGYDAASAGAVKMMADELLADEDGEPPTPHHCRKTYVEPVMEMLPGHPADDDKVCTSEAARREIAEEVEEREEREMQALLEHHVGLAVCAGQHMDTGVSDVTPKTEGYRGGWQDAREDVVQVIGEDAWEVVKQALYELYDSGESRYRSGAWEQMWAEWPGTARGLVDWWADEEADGGIGDDRREAVAEALAEYVPEERRSFDGETVEGE